MVILESAIHCMTCHVVEEPIMLVIELAPRFCPIYVMVFVEGA